MKPCPPILPDDPEQRDDDLWPGLQRFAERLSEIVEDLPATSPVLVSGDWGTGKTTLLYALNHRLTKKMARPAIWFDAWRYEGEAALLPAMLRAVWDAAPQAYKDRRESQSLFAHILRCAVAFGLRAIPAAVAALTGDARTFFATLTAGLSAASLTSEVKSVELKRPDEIPADTTRCLWESFAQLVDQAWPGKGPLILIDDLDRCSPEGAVRLLDAIRMLVSSACDLRCGFVVAIDRAVLAQAITKKFAGISGYDGNRFIEKLFPLSFAVPTPDERDAANLIRCFLAAKKRAHEGAEPAPSGLGSAPQSDMDLDYQDALSLALGDPTFANPRLMKRCINRFRLVIYFEDATRTSARDELDEDAPPSDKAPRDRILARWIAASERWPALRRMMVRRGHDEDYWKSMSLALAIQPSPAPDPDAHALLEEPNIQPWLKREIFSSVSARLSLYRNAESRLRRWGM